MGTAHKGAAVAAFTIAIMSCAAAPVSAQMTPQEEERQRQLEELEKARQKQFEEFQKALREQAEQQKKTAEEKFKELAEKGVFTGAPEKQQKKADTRPEIAAEKFKDLGDAGIFDKGGGSSAPKEIPWYVYIEAAAKAGIIPSVGKGPHGAPNEIPWYAYIEAAAKADIIPSVGKGPHGETIEEQLAVYLGNGMSGTAGGKSKNDWQLAGLIAAANAGLLSTTQTNQEQFRKDLVEAAYSAKAPGKWADYPFYADGSKTADPFAADFLDPPGFGAATYNGIVIGTDGNGDALNGTSFFDVNFAPGDTTVRGAFDFPDSDDHVKLIGLYSGGGLDLEVEPDQSLLGGSVDAFDFGAGFYGPNAEELGGSWDFTVNGGSAPGTASGDFAAKR